MTFEQILQMLMGSVGALGCLVFAVKWLDKDRDKLLKALTEERDGRLRLIEESNKQCADDRVILHRKLDEQDDEIKGLLKSMIGYHGEERETVQERIWCPKKP